MNDSRSVAAIELPSAGADTGQQPAVAKRHHGLPKDNQWWCLVGLVWLASLVYTCAMTAADPDLWGHTLYGLRAIEQGVLLESTDPFSYTAPAHRWINHEWLSEYQFAWLWTRWGDVGLWMWRNVAALAVFGAGLIALRRSRANLAAGTLLLIFTAECLAGFFIFVRPQLATLALFAISLSILRGYWDRPRSKWIWFLPLIMLLWVNLHGGFLAGLAITGLFTAAFALRCLADRTQWPAAGKLTGIMALSVLATLLNPYGFELYRMLWEHLIPEQAVREWQPLWAARQAPMYYVPFVLLVLALARSRRWQWIDALVLAVVAYQAVSHIRHIALLAIAVMVLLPGPLSESLSNLFRHLRVCFMPPTPAWRRWAAVGAAVAGLTALHLPGATSMWSRGLPPWRIAVESKSTSPGVPARAVAVIEKLEIRGNLLTDYGWGQYVLWRLHPKIRVAFDGRYRTVYPSDLEREFLDFHKLDAGGPARTAMLDRYDTEIVLLPAASQVCRYLNERPDWIQIHADPQAVLYLRNVPKYLSAIQAAQQAAAQHGAIVSEVPVWTRFPASPGAAGWNSLSYTVGSEVLAFKE